MNWSRVFSLRLIDGFGEREGPVSLESDGELTLARIDYRTENKVLAVFAPPGSDPYRENSRNVAKENQPQVVEQSVGAVHRPREGA